MANKPPAAGSSGAGCIISPTTATGRTIGRAGAAAKPLARPEDVNLHGRGRRKDPGGIDSPSRRSNGREVPRLPTRNKAPYGGGPLLDHTAGSRGRRPARQIDRDQPSFASTFGTPRCPTDCRPSERRCLTLLSSPAEETPECPHRPCTSPSLSPGSADTTAPSFRRQHVVVEQNG